MPYTGLGMLEPVDQLCTPSHFLGFQWFSATCCVPFFFTMANRAWLLHTMWPKEGAGPAIQLPQGSVCLNVGILEKSVLYLTKSMNSKLKSDQNEFKTEVTSELKQFTTNLDRVLKLQNCLAIQTLYLKP